ncbi:MAG: rRNA maturation RNase YbeY [Opitutae bacterium]|nr:rRNA maturation RNase YbeY [Opitutae bacterium]
MTRTVAITNRHPRLRFQRAQVARVITTLEANLSALRIPPSAIPGGELSLVFLTDPALAKIHGDFMADPTATDVITFAGDAAAGLAGEICVSADTARAYARAHRRDFSAELTLYLVHGWLHLAGHDDLPPAKKRRMRAAEARAMKLLRAARAVPVFSLL